MFLCSVLTRIFVARMTTYGTLALILRGETAALRIAVIWLHTRTSATELSHSSENCASNKTSNYI